MTDCPRCEELETKIYILQHELRLVMMRGDQLKARAKQALEIAEKSELWEHAGEQP